MRKLPTHRLPDGRELVYDLRPAGPDADRGAPVVVFLNGLSQTTIAWGVQANRLRPHRRVLLYDASGQGRSSMPPEGSRPEDHARDLLHLVDALDIETVDLVGFSFGSRTALRLVLSTPGVVRRLVLVGCAHRETVLRRWIVQGWADAMERGGHEELFRTVSPMVMGERWLGENERQYDAMLRAFVQRNDPVGIRRLLADSLLPGGSLGVELRAIAHPTLIIRGADDLVVPRELNAELAELIPGARYAEAPLCGHSVAIEEPDWFAETLGDFLLGD